MTTEERNALLDEVIGVVEGVYNEKYSHYTRDYRTEDALRDDIRKAITQMKAGGK